MPGDLNEFMESIKGKVQATEQGPMVSVHDLEALQREHDERALDEKVVGAVGPKTMRGARMAALKYFREQQDEEPPPQPPATTSVKV